MTNALLKTIHNLNHTFIVCTTARSGSTLLCRLLESNHIGGADEYFNEFHFKTRKWHKHFFIGEHCSFEEYLAKIVSATTTPYGAFGLKVMRTHLPFLKAKMEELTCDSVNSDFEAISKLMPNAKYIYLYRSDMLRQSISYYRAQRSQIWHIPAGTPKPSAPEVPFDFDTIRSLVGDCIHENKCWGSFFEQNGIKPLVLEYNEVIFQPTLVVDRVAKFIGIDGFIDHSATSLPLERVSESQSDDFYNRFLLLSQNQQPHAANDSLLSRFKQIVRDCFRHS